MTTTNDLILISRLSTALGITRSALYYWEKKGKVKFTRIKDHNYVTKDEFERVITEHSSNKTAICIFRTIDDDVMEIEKFKQHALKICKKNGYKLLGVFEFYESLSEMNNVNIILEYVKSHRLFIYGADDKKCKIKNKNIIVENFKYN